MKKTQLKELIKPLVKECIHEVLLEEGLLSNVVAEVAKGMQQTTLVEAQQPPLTSAQPTKINAPANEARQKLMAHKKSLMDSIGRDAYNGVNLFEGTEALSNSQPAQGQADLGDPRDAGVDISSLMGKSSAIWEALK